MNRAYSVFHAKDFDEDSRTFTGWATTPSLDRVGDVIDPMGASFKNPLTLLHQHDHRLPIGIVNFKKPTKNGIEFEATIPRVEGSATLRDRVDTAWAEIKHGLVRAVSIGFRALDYERRDDGGIFFKAIEIFELSSVSIPALPDAVITSVKSMSGDSIPIDVIQDISRIDLSARKSVGIPLVHVEQDALPEGCVKLISP